MLVRASETITSTNSGTSTSSSKSDSTDDLEDFCLERDAVDDAPSASGRSEPAAFVADRDPLRKRELQPHVARPRTDVVDVKSNVESILCNARANMFVAFCVAAS